MRYKGKHKTYFGSEKSNKRRFQIRYFYEKILKIDREPSFQNSGKNIKFPVKRQAKNSGNFRRQKKWKRRHFLTVTSGG
jgi:hypothetical protein